MAAATEPTRYLHSFDGTRIAVHERGDAAGRPIVLCNGLGGGFPAWSGVISMLRNGHRVVGYDYRGLDASGPAPTSRAYRVRDHARDLAEIVDQLELETPVIVGWSMGVQVLLELHRSHPGIPAAGVALFGTAGAPLDTAFDTPWTKAILNPFFRALQCAGGRSSAFEWLGSVPGVSGGVASVLRSLGWMGHHADDETFDELVRGFTRMDLSIYGHVFEELGRHDASDLLHRIETPFLVLSGGADPMVPAPIARSLASRLPNARHHTLEGATHFGVIEHAREIARAVEGFVSEAMSEAGGEPDGASA